jgi:mono/diheme cytochrome c family protein
MIRIQITLGLLLIVGSMALILFIGINEPARLATEEIAQQARAIEVGASLYEANCSGCHGVQGEGILGLCPPLNDEYFFTQRLEEVGYPGSLGDYIAATISGGRLISTRPDKYAGKMPPWSQEFGGPLRPDQIEDLTLFILNWEKTATGQVSLAAPTPPAPVAPGPEGAVERGQQVFVTSGCGGCHTIQGVSSGQVGPDLSKVGQVAAGRVPGKSAEEYLLEAVVNPDAFVVEGFSAGIMPQIYSTQLSQQQLDDLVAYLASLK